jgi:hypothetical protein
MTTTEIILISACGLVFFALSLSLAFGCGILAKVLWDRLHYLTPMPPRLVTEKREAQLEQILTEVGRGVQNLGGGHLPPLPDGSE